MKKCFKCHEAKALDDFYKHPNMGDGHLNKCKSCTKQDVQARNAALLATPEGLNAERARGRDKYARLYAKPRPPTLGKREVQRQWITRNPEKRAAHNAVTYALKSGRLVRQPCEVCNDPKSEAHHDDYSKPLVVRWLCKPHHAEHHWKARAA